MIEDGESVDSDDFLKVNNDNNGYQDSFSDSGSVEESFYANRQITSNFEDESLLEQSDFINREFSDYGQNPPFENQANNSNGNIDLNDNSYGNDDLNTYNDNDLYGNNLNSYNDTDLYGNSNLNHYNDDGLNNNDTNFHNEKDLFDNSENIGDDEANSANEKSLAEQNSINTDTEIDDTQPKQSEALSNRYSNNEDTEEKEENNERSSLSEKDLKEENEREINSEIFKSEKKTEAENDEFKEETEEESDKSKDVESEDFETNDIKSERDKNQDPKDFEDYNDGKEEIKNHSININLTNQFLSNLSKAQSNEDVEQEQSMSSDAEIEKKGNKNVLGKYSDFLEGLKTQAGVTDNKEDNSDIESDDSEDDADNTENIQTEKEDLSESDEFNFSESKVYDNSNAENKEDIENSVDEKREFEPKQEQQPFDPGAYLKNVINQNQNSENIEPKEEVKRTIFDDEDDEDIKSYNKEDIRKLLFDDEEEDEQEEIEKESYVQDIQKDKKEEQDKREEQVKQESQPFDASSYLKNLISSKQKEGKEEEPREQTSKIFERTAENAGNIAKPVEEKRGAESEIKQEQQAFDPGAYLKNIINQNQNKEEKDSNNEIKKDNLFADLSQNNLSDNSESDIEDASDDEMISKMMFRKMGIEDTEDDEEDESENVSDKKIDSSVAESQKFLSDNEAVKDSDREKRPKVKTIFDDDDEEEPDKTLREDSFAEQLLRKMQAMRVEREQGKNNFDTNEARYNPLSEYGSGRNYSSRTNEKANNDDRTNFESKQEIKETVQEEPVKQSIFQEIKADSPKESEIRKDGILQNADISSGTVSDSDKPKPETDKGNIKSQPTGYSSSFVDNILTYGYGWDDLYTANQEISDEEGLLNAFGVSNISYENGNANQPLSYDNNDPLKNIKKPEN